nr:acyltransferase family protein [Chloroflexaceae bacterium]
MSETPPDANNDEATPKRRPPARKAKAAENLAQAVPAAAEPKRRPTRKTTATTNGTVASTNGTSARSTPSKKTAPAAEPALALPASPPVDEWVITATPAASVHGTVLNDVPSNGVGYSNGYASNGSPASVAYELEVEVRERASNDTSQAANVGEFAAGVFRLIGENMERMTPSQVREAMGMLNGVNVKDYLDPDFWKGIGMVLQYQLNEQVAFVQRRIKGEYEVDEFGLDREIVELFRPLLTFMYRTWYQTRVEGLEHVPEAGRALLVANHSGVLPWDSAMIATAVSEDHPAGGQRWVRNLYVEGVGNWPVLGSTLAALGQAADTPENAARLLEADELVCVFPEGGKGSAKLYKDRYRLARFGRGTFVETALRTGSPLVPVAVRGAENSYPVLANLEPLAKLLRVPAFPITPFFPWLGLFGMIPLPGRWEITFCPPMDTSAYGPEAAD